ncbi:MAG: hypothetical protein NT090_04505 [Acidobacteria bacterium]|nr:hypothetical protein [Acidobacteriota bacterium]
MNERAPGRGWVAVAAMTAPRPEGTRSRLSYGRGSAAIVLE